MTQQPLRDRLEPRVRLRIPHFERHHGLSSARVHAFEDLDCRDWYDEFRRRIVSAVNEGRYLPLYRMGDGEYAFALGFRPEDRVPFWSLGAKGKVKRILARLGLRHHRSGSVEYGFETYTPKEHRELADRFVASMREVAAHGMLALGLDDSPFYGDYLPDILDWIDENEIPLGPDNYYHVYFLYALLHGPDRADVLRGRRVLVVTGLDEEKERGIRAGLEKEGVADIQFLPISRAKAMSEELDLAGVVRPIDLALVGAGVGAVNIVHQLRPLSAPALDCGFVLSTLGQSDLRWSRPYCVPDEEFDSERVRFMGAASPTPAAR